MKRHQIAIVIGISLLASIATLAYLVLNQPRKQTVHVEANTTLVKQSAFNFEGHRYVIMEWTLGRAGPELTGTQLIHDPDCPCKDKK